MALIHHPLVFTFGLLGNIISFMVYLAPVPTFWRVYKKKSTEGFQSLPYVCAIFSAMLWIYYAFVKTNSVLLITINSFGCVIETIYIAIFLTYAPRQAKMTTLKLLVLLNLVGFCSIIIVCTYLAKGSTRVQLLGGFCDAFSVVVFAAPLSVMRMVIRTKSVEFMPFPLSLSLTISAVMWFMYGLLKKDLYVVLPNVLGFKFGVAQMVLYGIYRNRPNKVESKDMEMKLSEKISCDVPVEIDTAIKAEAHLVVSPPRTDGIDEVVVDVVEEKKTHHIYDHDDDDNDNQSVQPRELHVHALCGVHDNINMVGSIPTGANANTIQLVNCVV